MEQISFELGVVCACAIYGRLALCKENSFVNKKKHLFLDSSYQDRQSAMGSENIMDELATLIRTDIPEGRQSLQDSYTNLARVAEYCEDTYYR